MAVHYSILNTTITTEESISMFRGFEAENLNEKESEMVWEFQNAEANHCCYGVQYMTRKDLEAMKQIFFSQKDKTQYLYTTKEDYSELHLNVDRNCAEDVLMELLMAGFYSYMTMKDSLLMHASAVAYEGKGIVFTAPSGAGKTTQAELWTRYKKAKILNGDKVFLKMEKDGIHAWGSPWKGSSPYACNDSAKLRAIVVLEQADENNMKKLSGLEAMQYVVPHVFYPCWDEKCEQAVLTFLNQVLKETEIFLLKCKPNEAAVELLASIIKE